MEKALVHKRSGFFWSFLVLSSHCRSLGTAAGNELVAEGHEFKPREAAEAAQHFDKHSKPMPTHDKSINTKPDVRATHQIFQPGNHHQ